MRHVVLLALTLTMVRCTQPKPETKATPAPEYFKIDPSTAAKLRGTVRFVGKKPPAMRISMDAEEACQKLHKRPVSFASITTDKKDGLSNAFVYIKSGLEDKIFEPPKEAVVLDQRGCMFVPRVIALRSGQTLAVKNSDPVSHNIHPTPEDNREWNQQQSPGAPDLERRFARPEVMIPVKCNVHAWMRSYIGVLDHPYFAVTGSSGEFEWAALPPGEYTVAAWHESLGELTEKVRLDKSAEGSVTFTFRLTQKVN
jgi:hypothetical protein